MWRGSKNARYNKFHKIPKVYLHKEASYFPHKPMGQAFRNIIPINNVYNLGPYWGIMVNHNIPNTFWRETFFAWNEIYQQVPPNNIQDILSMPIWYNSKFGDKKLYVKNWHLKGISVIGDLLNEDLSVLSREALEQKYGFRIQNFLNFFRVRSLVHRFVTVQRMLIESKQGCSLERPHIPHHIAMLLQCSQGCKSIYNKVTNSNKQLDM